MSQTHNDAMGENTGTRTQGIEITDGDLLAEIRRLANGNAPPTVMEVHHYGAFSIDKYHDRFGSWPAAVEQAMSKDMTVRTRRHHEITDGELLAEIRRLADGDDPPTVTEMKEDGAYSAMAYHRRFGSWNAAIREAMGEDVSLNTGGNTKIPEADLLAELRRLATDGQPPKLEAMRNEGRCEWSPRPRWGGVPGLNLFMERVSIGTDLGRGATRSDSLWSVTFSE